MRIQIGIFYVCANRAGTGQWQGIGDRENMKNKFNYEIL